MGTVFQTDLILDYLRKVHQSSPQIFILFTGNRVIQYTNREFQKKFHLTSPEEFIGKQFDFLYLKEDDRLVPFSKVPINKILTGSQIFSYFADNQKEHFFYVYTFYAGDTKSETFYYSILQEITDIEKKLLNQSVQALVVASQLKDNDTGNHVKRVSAYSYSLTKHIYDKMPHLYSEIDEDYIEEIFRVAAMHDVGKIGTPDSILTKPGKLTDDEFNIMKEHTINGAFILSKMVGQMARDIALFHHEKWNGTGYPYQLKGDQIPLSARIVSLVDVYDALRMKRPYKLPLSHEETIEYIKKQRKEHFDPQLVDVFLEIEQEFADIFYRMRDLNEEPFHENYLFSD